MTSNQQYKELKPAVKKIECDLIARCPVVKNGGTRCRDHQDCQTYEYIMTGKMKVD
jgi:hypothetical protein